MPWGFAITSPKSDTKYSTRLEELNRLAELVLLGKTNEQSVRLCAQLRVERDNVFVEFFKEYQSSR